MVDDLFDRAAAGVEASRKVLRRRGQRRMLAQVLIGLGVGVLTFVLVLTFVDRQPPQQPGRTTLDPWLPWIVWGLIIVTLVRVLGRRQQTRLSELWALDRRTRRGIRHALLRGRPMADPHLAALALDASALLRAIAWPMAGVWFAFGAASGERLVRHMSALPPLDGLGMVGGLGLGAYVVLLAYQTPKADEANRACLRRGSSPTTEP